MRGIGWKKLFNLDGHDRNAYIRDEMRALLPTRRELPPSPIPAREVTKVAMRLKRQIEAVVPCELEADRITMAHSRIITPGVIATAKAAGGDEFKACVVYCLLVCKKWFRRQAVLELWDADLHDGRALACEVIAKHIIEGEEDQQYLLEDVLLKRYSILLKGEETAPANAIERAVDLHALRVIGSSGYQKCIQYLWGGWLVQDDEDPSRFEAYKHKTNTNYWVHFDPDRMRVPRYQNALQIIISLVYLGLFTGAVNTVNRTGALDVVEVLLYLFTFGFICDEVAKFWKVGRWYFSFWNAFNMMLYALLTVSFVVRVIALGYPVDSQPRHQFNELSYNFLAFSAPMFWIRLLLYLDTFRFFGAMLVVMKVMMKESLIFFALLIVVLVGFLQAFVGLDQVDNNLTATSFIVQAMLNAIMQSPEFDGFDRFAPPFGLILYYIFTFVVMVILLNVLIALYNSAYEDITDNAVDEYMALFAAKTMQFVRAPDENVFIAPFNLIELFLLVLPFEWWFPRAKYQRLNDYVMGIIYSPLLLVTAAIETRQAHFVRDNRRRGEEDDDTIEEWEELDGDIDFEGEGWDKKVRRTCPDVASDPCLDELKKLKSDVRELRLLVEELVKNGAAAGPASSSESAQGHGPGTDSGIGASMVLAKMLSKVDDSSSSSSDSD